MPLTRQIPTAWGGRERHADPVAIAGITRRKPTRLHRLLFPFLPTVGGLFEPPEACIQLVPTHVLRDQPATCEDLQRDIIPQHHVVHVRIGDERHHGDLGIRIWRVCDVQGGGIRHKLRQGQSGVFRGVALVKLGLHIHKGDTLGSRLDFERKRSLRRHLVHGEPFNWLRVLQLALTSYNI